MKLDNMTIQELRDTSSAAQAEPKSRTTTTTEPTKPSTIELRLRKELGLKPTTKTHNSPRLQKALSFAQAHPGKKIDIYESADAAWGKRSNRANEGIMDAKIIGVSGNPRSKQGYTYLWIYAYESKKCIHCNKLIMWGHNNPMAPICDDCKKKGV